MMISKRPSLGTNQSFFEVFLKRSFLCLFVFCVFCVSFFLFGSFFWGPRTPKFKLPAWMPSGASVFHCFKLKIDASMTRFFSFSHVESLNLWVRHHLHLWLLNEHHGCLKHSLLHRRLHLRLHGLHCLRLQLHGRLRGLRLLPRWSILDRRHENHMKIAWKSESLHITSHHFTIWLCRCQVASIADPVGKSITSTLNKKLHNSLNFSSKATRLSKSSSSPDLAETMRLAGHRLMPEAVDTSTNDGLAKKLKLLKSQTAHSNKVTRRRESYKYV